MTQPVRTKRTPIEKAAEDTERLEALVEVEQMLELPVMILGFVWLGLLVLQFVRGLSPFLQSIVLLIWVIFILDFSLRFLIAPDKIAFLKLNWLTALSLFIPALRFLRFARLIELLRLSRATEGVGLVKVVGTIKRGMGSLRLSLGARGFGYVILLTGLVIFVGAAGMFAFERAAPGGPGFQSYGDALWWTAMTITTLGGAYSPKTFDGRALAFMLAVYAFTIFGYITANLATFFIDQDASNSQSNIPDAQTLEDLRQEVASLRTEIQNLNVPRNNHTTKNEQAK